MESIDMKDINVSAIPVLDTKELPGKMLPYDYSRSSVLYRLFTQAQCMPLYVRY